MKIIKVSLVVKCLIVINLLFKSVYSISNQFYDLFFDQSIYLIELFNSFLAEKFRKIDGISVDSRYSSKAFLKSKEGLSKLGCVTQCTFDENCFMTNYFNNKTCFMYNETAKDLLIDLEETDSFAFHVKQK